ncbi:alkaline ceramidase family protein [Pseudomassariella vexata]|uniref:Alkaline ceramidase family protein n=1 Tax=Pseudomassariella vexata TaxID=1141098 RepID=A0A1Y2E9L9_9PEZI|nr:alkaline ceramidase family protein [Pseudomassariella vexata]ORY67555.1 alkaline ceramidase family protein [Pseudomassariella vexata]
MGHHNHHFSGDPHASMGFWGTPTSAANFCEEDYAVTRYIAEFINSLTNLAYIYLALRHPRRPGAKKAFWPFDSMATALFILGVFSGVFHATMHQATQFCDELAMIILGTAYLQKLYASGQSPTMSWVISALIVANSCFWGGVYVYTGNILHHVYIFNTMLAVIGVRTFYMFYGMGRSKEEKARLLRRYGKSLVILISGYVLWNIDLERCFELRKIRGAIGMPWSWLLEFHGWWHVLTAVGANEYILLVRELCDS